MQAAALRPGDGEAPLLTPVLTPLTPPQAACVLDPSCLASLSCTASCQGDTFQAGLCAWECGERGLRSGALSNTAQ